jgi:hypothetical protein
MNVQEIIGITNERKNKLKAVTEKIIDNIHKKIKYYAKLKRETCSYIIPPIIDDFPIYDRETLAKDIYKVLDEEGFIVCAFANGQIDICWNEKLVQKKVSNDRYILKQEENRLNKFNKQTKIINDRFTFLANPNKVIKEVSLEEKLDQQVEKILKEKQKKQMEFSKRIGNFNKF